MKLLKKEEGSILLWAIVLLMTLMIILSAGFSISFSYINRSIKNNSREQAYLYAKAVGTNLAQIVNAGSEAEKALLIPATMAASDVKRIKDVQVHSSSTTEIPINLGTASATIQRVEMNKILIEVRAVSNEQEYNLDVYMVEYPGYWMVEHFAEQEE